MTSPAFSNATYVPRWRLCEFDSERSVLPSRKRRKEECQQHYTLRTCTHENNCTPVCWTVKILGSFVVIPPQRRNFRLGPD
jgi:hypothetical protein